MFAKSTCYSNFFAIYFEVIFILFTNFTEVFSVQLYFGAIPKKNIGSASFYFKITVIVLAIPGTPSKRTCPLLSSATNR